MAGLPQRCGQRVHREVQPQLPHVLRHGRVACVLAAVTHTQTMWRNMNNLISRFSLPSFPFPFLPLTLSAFIIVSSLVSFPHLVSIQGNFLPQPPQFQIHFLTSSFSILPPVSAFLATFPPPLSRS